MKIRKAIKLALEGKKIRRPHWDKPISVEVSGVGNVLFSYLDQIDDDGHLDAADLLADDWEVVE